MKLLTIILAVFFSLNSNACITPRPFQNGLKESAETVFIGKFRDLKYNSRKKWATVTMDVKKTIRGQKKKSWSFKIGKNVNTTAPTTAQDFIKCYGKESEIGLHRKIHHYWPVQGPCDLPYILPVHKKVPVGCDF